MTPPESVTVAVELAQMRGDMNTGIADIKGTLAVLIERSNRTEQDVRTLRADMETEVRDVRAELAAARAETEALKSGRWPLPAIGALTGVAGVVVAAIALYLT